MFDDAEDKASALIIMDLKGPSIQGQEHSARGERGAFVSVHERMAGGITVSCG